MGEQKPVKKTVRCTFCNGTGKRKVDGEFIKCYTCDGKGKYDIWIEGTPKKQGRWW